MNNDAGIAAIEFALTTEDGLSFLREWNEGNFAAIRAEWPDAPEDVFIGADPLHPSSIHNDVKADVTTAAREVHLCLNYGGIFVGCGPTNDELELAYDMGDIQDEVPHMRRFACALNALADALEAENTDE